MSLLLLGGVLLTEALIMQQLKNTITQRRLMYSLFTVAALISFLIIVDLENLKTKGGEILGNSFWASIFASILIIILVTLDRKNPTNIYGNTLRKMNKNSYNLLLVTLLISVIFVLKDAPTLTYSL